jgi:hypothetical protein
MTDHRRHGSKTGRSACARYASGIWQPALGVELAGFSYFRRALTTRGLAVAAVAIIGFCITSGTAVARPVQWTLANVTFSDGGTASGSFTYDADTNVFSAVDIVTISGTVVTGQTYAFTCNCGPGEGAAVLFALAQASNTNLSGAPFLWLPFAAPMTDAGGTIAINNANAGFNEGHCTGANCSSAVAPKAARLTGQIVGAPPPAPVPTSVPTLSPLAMILLIAGLAGLGWRMAPRAAA